MSEDDERRWDHLYLDGDGIVRSRKTLIPERPEQGDLLPHVDEGDDSKQTDLVFDTLKSNDT